MRTCRERDPCKDGGVRRTRAYYMRLDIPALLDSQAVVLLPGWRESRGANLEVWIALDLDMPVYECSLNDGDLTVTRVTTLEPFPMPFASLPEVLSAEDDQPQLATSHSPERAATVRERMPDSQASRDREVKASTDAADELSRARTTAMIPSWEPCGKLGRHRSGGTKARNSQGR